MKNKAFLLSMAGMSAFSIGVTAQKPANIILINLDDSGNGDFSCRGAVGYQTPHIDWLSAGGTRRLPFRALPGSCARCRPALLQSLILSLYRIYLRLKFPH